MIFAAEPFMRFTLCFRLWVGLGLAGLSVSLAAAEGLLLGLRTEGNKIVAMTTTVAAGSTVREVARLPVSPDQRLSDVFQFPDGTIGSLWTSTARNAGKRALLRRLGSAVQVVDTGATDVSGVSAPYAVSSIVVPPDGAALALVSHYSDTPPFFLADVSVESGQVTVLRTYALNPAARFANLARCLDGTIYATSMAQQWDTRLVRIDAGTRAVESLPELHFDNRSLKNDVWDLACAPTGQLYALADPTLSGTNSLYQVDPSTGALRLVQAFDATKMVFLR